MSATTYNRSLAPSGREKTVIGYWAVNHLAALVALATGHTFLALYCTLSGTTIVVLILLLPVPSCLYKSVLVSWNVFIWARKHDPSSLLNALSTLMSPQDFECLQGDLNEMMKSTRKENVDEWYTRQLKSALWDILKSKVA